MQACLRSPDCACFTAVPVFDTSCASLKELDTAAKIAKTACVSPSQEGSFGACSKVLKGAAPLVAKCCTPDPTTTTTVTTTTTGSARIIKNRMRAFNQFKPIA